MAKHIGIVAVSPEGAALCYRHINREVSRILPEDEHPRITIHNEPLARYIKAVHSNDWHEVGRLLSISSKILAGCGAEFCITPDNAVQHAIHLAESESPIPWLTTTDLVAVAIEREERSCVGIIGTRLVMTGSTYQTHLGLKGINVIPPDAEDIDEIDRIIFQELIYGTIKPESEQLMIRVISKLADNGCEGIILGCSEAPLLITCENSPLPVYDAALVLANGSVHHAIC